MSLYPVASIFRSIQGEGHFVGVPMTFVRLAGCSVLDCAIRSRCDEAPWKATSRLRADDIFYTCQAFAETGIVCITGGEPTDHDLLPLVVTLRDRGYRVHIETSGVRSIDGIPFDWITVSPKTKGYKQRQGHTLKLVVLPEWGEGAKDPMEASWAVVKSHDGDYFHRYLQPLSGPDGKPVNLPFVLEMLKDMHNGGGRWALSTQAHKNWGVQ
jgi:organic radical activating enzyme